MRGDKGNFQVTGQNYVIDHPNAREHPGQVLHSSVSTKLADDKGNELSIRFLIPESQWATPETWEGTLNSLLTACEEELRSYLQNLLTNKAVTNQLQDMSGTMLAQAAAAGVA